MRNDAPNNLGFVDPACPLEWGHPLNRGLVGEWAVVPNAGWRGGTTFRDLVRGGRRASDGTLTNGPTWAGRGARPGGCGALNYAAGSSQYVDCGAAASLDLSASITLAAWVQGPPSFGGNYRLVAAKGTTGRNYMLAIDAGAGSHGLFIGCNGITGLSSDVDIGAGNALAAGVWCHLAFVFDFNLMSYTVYKDGLQVYQQTGGSNVPTTTAEPLVFGKGTGGFGYANSRMDGFAVWGRAFSGGVAAALYAESRRGNPERWRWAGRRTYFGPPTSPPPPPPPASFNPGWATGATRVIGPGVAA